MLAIAGILVLAASYHKWLGSGGKVVLKTHIATLASAGNSDPLNILIIGNNARNAQSPLSLGTGGGQADILILAHVDLKNQKITLVSIPRDTLIALPNWDVPIPKIKSVLTLGLAKSPQDGADMAMKYVSELTGMPVNYYVAVDFQGFADAVNAVQGIRVDIPARLYDPLHSQADFYPGWQTLNGEQALAYVRIRQNEAGNGYRVNDFQRQQAEMQVLGALKEKILHSYSSIPQILSLAQVIKNDVATNLGPGQTLTLARALFSARLTNVYLGSDRDSMDILSTPVPGLNYENYLLGAYYDILDPAHVYALLKPYGSTGPVCLPALPAPASVQVAVYGPPQLAGQLREANFNVTYMGRVSNTSQISIEYPPGKISWAWAVGRFCGNGNEVLLMGPPGLTRVVYINPY